ncbi:MAG: DnaJ domain-containing protein [Proteobacteria bacterium]|nr:DnaJ domain-containing protein [Pseudomonadota bacterium]
MKLNSKYFDSIRISRGEEPKTEARSEGCQWRGCKQPGTHRAPRGRGQEGFYRFCIDHVRQFNASYNYFDGMSNSEVEDFQKASTTGHRPTWRLGGGDPGIRASDTLDPSQRYAKFARQRRGDAHRLFEGTEGAGPAAEKKRPLKALERKALNTLHLPETARKDDIKTRFKELVKRHHPDANGGDRGSEEKLREIIQAYNYLKQAGLV